MNFAELTNLFESYTGTSSEIDPAQLALWFNEAQLDLNYALGTISEYVYEDALAYEKYDRPEGCLRIVDSSVDYKTTPSGKLVFEEGGDVLVYYRSVPGQFTGTDNEQTSSLPGVTHYLMAIYAASRYWDMESEGDAEESNHATKWMQYYYNGKRQAMMALDVQGSDVDRWVVI